MGSNARTFNCVRTLTLNINDAFPGKYFKAADVAEPKTLTITGVGMEQLQDGTQKPAVYFSESQQAFVLNKTNANFMSQAFGAQTEGWTGKQVILYKDQAAFQGRMVDCVRVKAAGGSAAPAAPAPANTDDVPF